MPLVDLTLIAGTDFDGAATTGEVLFLFSGAPNTGDDTKRALVYTVAIHATDTLTSLRVRLAPNLASAVSGTSFIALLDATDVADQQLAGCRIVVPLGWNLYAFTAEATPEAKTLIVDWTRNANREGMF